MRGGKDNEMEVARGSEVRERGGGSIVDTLWRHSSWRAAVK